ncbi:Hypothetical predicted protein [Cloeon dipterum]|uniref:BTB domain-containing protein n=1 Tax=Cloeon dipterum TaxID=197152 RepID=A0A8S1BUQ6_9INSE|nr:Hypothetical predicted protein [Cloeon dipterum]
MLPVDFSTLYCSTISINRTKSWYTESFHYDCTIRVGRENSKLFKCHKIVLASSSEAFASMLYGNFDEGSKKKR